jgi:hypothetical protein
MGENRVMHSAERVMRALCSLRRRILPIALALFPGALVLHLDRVTRVLQVPAFQLDDFPSGYHVRTCLKCAEDLNRQYPALLLPLGAHRCRLRKPSSGESVQQLWELNRMRSYFPGQTWPIRPA